MLTSAMIEAALRDALPPSLHQHLAGIAQILAAAARGDLSTDAAEAQLVTTPAFGQILQALASKEPTTSGGLISFGQGSQLGDVGINDIVGGNLLRLTINNYYNAASAAGSGEGERASASPQEAKSAGRKPLVYEDMTICLGFYNETDRTFKVWVEGLISPDAATLCRYDPGTFWDDPSTSRGGLISGLERRELEAADLLRLGILLADLALPNRPNSSIRSLFLEKLADLQTLGKGLRLRLRIEPPVLAQLPWEYLALAPSAEEPQPADFCALRRDISIVRTHGEAAAELRPPNQDVVRIVGVLANPTDQDSLAVHDVRDALTSAVKGLNKAARQEQTDEADLVTLHWAARPATVNALHQVVTQGADIFHFVGHAIVEQPTGRGKIVLEHPDRKSDFYDGDTLAQLLGNASVRLVVLGTCESAQRDGAYPWSSVAPTLNAQHIPAVIANYYSFKDTSVELLARTIYPLLFAGYTIDEAVFQARRAIFQARGLEQRDWGVPIIFLQTGADVLFPKPAPESGKSKSPFLRITIASASVAGTIVGLEADTVRSGRVEVEIKADRVEQSAVVKGAVIKKIDR